MSPTSTPSRNPLTRLHRRYGWTALLLWLLFGVALEALHGFKVSAYLQDPLRMSFWSLAHFHGATLALVNLVYVPWVESVPRPWQTPASWSLLLGSLLMPLGFLLGGWFHFGGDPGYGIFLAPPAALLILFTLTLQAWSAWRS